MLVEKFSSSKMAIHCPHHQQNWRGTDPKGRPPGHLIHAYVNKAHSLAGIDAGAAGDIAFLEDGLQNLAPSFRMQTQQCCAIW